MIAEFIEHDHDERNHQVSARLLNYYYRAA